MAAEWSKLIRKQIIILFAANRTFSALDLGGCGEHFRKPQRVLSLDYEI